MCRVYVLTVVITNQLLQGRMYNWQEPNIDDGMPVPPPKRPRRKPPRKPSSWLLFLRKLKPGQSFVCSYSASQAALCWLRRLNFEFRQARTRDIPGKQVRIWILKRPDMPQISPAVLPPKQPRDFSFGRDIFVRIGLAKDGFQCDTFCYYDSVGAKQVQRVAHDVTCRDFGESYSIAVVQAAAVDAIHNAITNLETTHLRKHPGKSNGQIKILPQK